MSPLTAANRVATASQHPNGHTPPLLRQLISGLASLTLAVALIVVLAGVLAAATIVETYLGAAAARWYVYESPWFFVLLALLAVNIAGAAVVRFPWQRHQTGFVVTHVGLLILLLGAAISAGRGEQGRVTLNEGESADEMIVDGHSRVTAFAVGDSAQQTYEFTFAPRPFDWDAERSLHVGEVDGVAVDVIALVHQPQLQQRWVADQARIGGPAVRFQVNEAAGRQVAEAWLVDQQFGEPGNIGPLRMQLARALNDAMLADFQDPPKPETLGEYGLLLAYCGDDVLRVPIDANVGRAIAIGESGLRVEVAEYLPNARPDRLGTFTSVDDRPLNPLLELRVLTPDADEPLRQVASAKEPRLNLDGVYGRVCPVTFRYLHPAVSIPFDVQLLQTPDGRLHARTVAEDRPKVRGELKRGDTLTVPGGFELKVIDHLPHARRDISFEAAPHRPRTSQAEEDEPAALVRLSVGDEQHDVWMRRNDPIYGRRVISTAGGAWALEFDNARTSLGVRLELVDFERRPNPGNVGNAAFISRVRVQDDAGGVDREEVVSMNQPLAYRGRHFYQFDFEESDHGGASSTFSVTIDPGRPLKYLGGLLVCCGIALMFYMRAYSLGHSSSATAHVAAAGGPVSPESQDATA